MLGSVNPNNSGEEFYRRDRGHASNVHSHLRTNNSYRLEQLVARRLMSPWLRKESRHSSGFEIHLPRLTKIWTHGTSFDSGDVIEALKMIIESHKEVKRFEYCAYMHETTLYEHELGAISDLENYFDQAGLDFDSMRAEFMQAAILMHDFGEHGGETYSSALRARLGQSKTDAVIDLRSQTEAMVARLTILLALDAVKNGKPADSLYAKFTRESRERNAKAKAETNDPVLAASVYLMRFVDENKQKLDALFASDCGLVVQDMMSVIEPVEEWQDTGDFNALVSKLTEKLNTYALTADRADFSQIDEQEEYPETLGYLDSVIEKLESLRAERSPALQNLAQVVIDRASFARVLMEQKFADTADQRKLVNADDYDEEFPATEEADEVFDASVVDLFGEDTIVDSASLCYGDRTISSSGAEVLSSFGEDRLFTEMLQDKLKPIARAWDELLPERRVEQARSLRPVAV
ncbi:MAG: hypothetical protein OXU45_03645 [Candidatus Melainabacteria bacterium]|nr:hypothetical protein [Candidatus Melainabacteria bacterium]